ncbi:glucosaminidase domain-containing protein [Alicyclobacillus sp. SO9]|uniref:glucosaminidase domain-containing protein n=1 Tax=Alicyclobacillus sp. SO9 TaxID=2665646 RepID=UPI0018E7B163|nr:glucosaminidase domain-containing protein [Alicyclobacillus sp. SO9]QQE78731.1 glucosaminidase domain-containing protein [Alicyclobacillus sp. SO9]
MKNAKLSLAILALALPTSAAYLGLHPQTAYAQSSPAAPVYYTYHKPGGNIVGVYNSIQKAVASLAQTPGGIVKNSSWATLYQQPLYRTYASTSSSNVMGTYPTLPKAAATLSGTPGGVVRDQQGNVVFNQPDTRPHYYTYSSDKSNTIVGVFRNIQQAVSSLQGKTGYIVKNQKWQVVYTQPKTDKYFTYHKASGSIVGVYSSLNSAVLSLNGYPGGIVKNSSWVPVFQEPSPSASPKYYTYPSSNSNQIIGAFSSISDAVASLQNKPGGIVKNQNWVKLYTEPNHQTYFTYDSASSSNITGMYNTEQSAVAVLANTPGGIIKNSSWQVVYRQPVLPHSVYLTYDSSSSNQITGMYPTLGSAITSVSAQPGAIIKNQNWAVVYQQTTYDTYASPDSSKVLQTFPSRQSAIASLTNTYGGVVKTSGGQTIFSQPEKYFTYSSQKSNTILGIYWSLRNAKASLGSIPGGIVKNAQWQQVYMQPLGNYYATVDLRFPSPKSVTAGQINSWLTKNPNSGGSPLQGLGSAYLWTQSQYSVNAVYLLSHSIDETGWGNSNFALGRNNLFGFAAYTNTPDAAASFPSAGYAIAYEGWFVKHQYLDSNGAYYSTSKGPTLLGMAQNYATAGVSGWADPIASIMNQYVTSTAGPSGFVDYPQYLASNQPPAPLSTSNWAPIYHLQDAVGKITGGSNYSSVPIMPASYQGSPGYQLGASLMYQGPVKEGDISAAVREMQTLLLGAGYSPQGIDGDFGPNTLSALHSFEAANSLSLSTECDASTWQKLVEVYASRQGIPLNYLNTSDSVSIDGIVLGMVGSQFVQWYHVPNKGWIDAQYVSLSNVQKIEPSSYVDSSGSLSVTPSTVQIPVYSAPGSNEIGTVHAGDYVVTSSSSAGYVGVSVVKDDGTVIRGVVKSNMIKMLGLPGIAVPASS